MAENETTSGKGRSFGLVGAVVSAVVASACCIGPLLFVLIGTGGAFAGTFAFLEPFRPWFITVAVAFLGYGFYRVYRKPKPKPGEIDCACEDPKKVRRDKAILWIATVVIAALLAVPYAVPVLAGAGSATVIEEEGAEHVVLRVRNMTCAGCAVIVRKSLERLDGVLAAEVTFDPPLARVAYDPELVTLEEMTEATTEFGYPSSPERKHEQ